MNGERLPRRFGKRPTEPRLVQLLKRCFDLATTGQFDTRRSCHGSSRRGGSMELGEHLRDGSPLNRVVVAKPACLSGHEREQRDGVALPDSTQRLAAVRGDRCDYEPETAFVEGGGGVIRASETVEHRLAFVFEPGLPVEFVDGDEGAGSLAVSHDPVVATGPDGRVIRRADVEAPTVSEETDQCT